MIEEKNSLRNLIVGIFLVCIAIPIYLQTDNIDTSIRYNSFITYINWIWARLPSGLEVTTSNATLQFGLMLVLYNSLSHTIISAGKRFILFCRRNFFVSLFISAVFGYIILVPLEPYIDKIKNLFLLDCINDIELLEKKFKSISKSKDLDFYEKELFRIGGVRSCQDLHTKYKRIFLRKKFPALFKEEKRNEIIHYLSSIEQNGEYEDLYNFYYAKHLLNYRRYEENPIVYLSKIDPTSHFYHEAIALKFNEIWKNKGVDIAVDNIVNEIVENNARVAFKYYAPLFKNLNYGEALLKYNNFKREFDDYFDFRNMRNTRKPLKLELNVKTYIQIDLKLYFTVAPVVYSYNIYLALIAIHENKLNQAKEHLSKINMFKSNVLEKVVKDGLKKAMHSHPVITIGDYSLDIYQNYIDSGYIEKIDKVNFKTKPSIYNILITVK